MKDVSTLPLPASARVLACGAFLKNRAGRLEAERFAWSALHGDLGEAEACRSLDAAAEALLTQGGVDAIAHDLHPDFHSTRLALALGERLAVPVIGVQHHHAHIAAVIAEAGLAKPVIGLALDGVGLGTDGTAWGGEVLWVDGGNAAQRWERVAHLHPIALPGGDVAAREPWRLAAAVLHALGRGGEIEARFGAIVGAPTARGLAAMLERGLNCPASSGAGRWFDAAAGALGLSVRQTFEAEAAIALEKCAAQALPAAAGAATFAPTLDLRGVVAELFDVPRDDAAARARAALRFHHALADGLADTVVRAAQRHGCDTVVFGGGCFLNRVLSERLAWQLESRGLALHAPRQVPCGDAGLALGQAWVAACSVAAAATAPHDLALEI